MVERKNRFSINDIIGGFSGAAVALPQSMGLGIVLFSAMGYSASVGAMAGLIGAIILLLVTGTVGASIGVISAPNGPMTMLIVGVVSAMALDGVSSDLMLLTLSAILIMTGIFQIIFALFGGAQLIKYIPYPVVVGLVTGVGILMLKSQWSLLSGGWNSFVPLSLQEAYPLIIALLTGLIMIVVPKMTKNRVPGAVGGLFVGIAFFYLLSSFTVVAIEESWMVGLIPSISSLHLGFSFENIDALPLEIIILSSLALTVLGTTDSLVTSLLADSKTRERHNSKKEIVVQGSAEILIGMVGGLGGWGTKGATLVAIEAGGRRWSAVMAGVFFLLLVLFAGFAGKYLPISVLAGIVAMVGVGMIDMNILTWLKHRKTRIDALVSLLVIISIVTFNLVTAVGIGVVISILLFVGRHTRSSIIHRRVTGKNYRSFCARSNDALDILDNDGDTIVLYELEGDLFFATADKLRTHISEEITEEKIIILHFRRVKYIDMSAMIVLLQVSQEASEKGSKLIFCHLHRGLGFGKKASKAFRHVDSKQKFTNKVFRDTDRAFEYAENQLLKLKGYKMLAEDREITVENNNFCSKMNAEQKALIRSIGTIHTLKKHEALFDKGEHGASLFMLIKGEIEIRLYTDKHEYKRLAKYGSGTYFGEISFVNPGPRVAQAIALNKVNLFELKRDALLQLDEKEQSKLALALLFEIGTTLSDELRRSAADIHRLEQW